MNTEGLAFLKDLTVPDMVITILSNHDPMAFNLFPDLDFEFRRFEIPGRYVSDFFMEKKQDIVTACRFFHSHH